MLKGINSSSSMCCFERKINWLTGKKSDVLLLLKLHDNVYQSKGYRNEQV